MPQLVDSVVAQLQQLAETIFDQVRLTTLLDVGITAILIYWLFSLIRGTRAVRLVLGVSFLFALYALAQWFDLRMVSQILQTGAVVGIFAFVVVFQPELRRGLERIGRVGSFAWLISPTEQRQAEHVAAEVARAAAALSAQGHGALIVLERETGLEEIAETGVMIHGDLTADLLETIFMPRSPLHDGAVIVRGDRVLGAGALLPLAETTLHSQRFGTRHRAALGITEQTDAVVVVVSEENGQVSLVERARIVRNLNEPQLARAIISLLDPAAARRSLLGRVRETGATASRRRRRPTGVSWAPAPAAEPISAGRGTAGDARPADAINPAGPTNPPAPTASSESDNAARQFRLAAAGRGSVRACLYSVHAVDAGRCQPVRRLIGFVVHNWPLKLAAIVLASLLYAGLVLSQSARTWPGPIPIQVIHQPSSAFIVGSLPDVTNVQYFAPVDVADRVSSSAFVATVDLATANAAASEPFLVPVRLQGPDGVNIIDYTPREIYVRLDPLVTSTVPVTVDHGTVPEGLRLGETTLSQSTATVSGPESVVNQVVAAVARVRIQASGIDVDQLVDLVPVDGRGEVLSPVELTPTSVRVSIPVGTPAGTKTVPVNAVVTGTPAAGFEVATTSITPPVATVAGETSTLAGLTSVPTQPVDVTNATTTVAQSVGLNLPGGITQVGEETFDVSITMRATESTRTLSAGLIVVGAEPSRTYTVGVDSVNVTLGGGAQALNAVNAGSFVASVDVAGLSTGSHDVDVVVVPVGDLHVIAVSPERVTVFVSEAATPPPSPSPTPVTPSTSPPGTSVPPASETAPQQSPASAEPSAAVKSSAIIPSGSP